ncbi:hypothetical protein DRA42_03670 [Ethanoligenens harbinense]|nr:hypothetical protein DRA42_03670 [Ethanoligenens harbinense]
MRSSVSFAKNSAYGSGGG